MTQLEQQPMATRADVDGKHVDATRVHGKKPNRTRKLFFVDLSFFALFLLVINVPLTGLTIHEWLGITIGAVTIVHLAQHTDWIASTLRRVFGATSVQNRVNYLMMIGLFVGFASIIVSGLLISEAALPWLGYTPGGGPFWLWLHLSSVGWVIALVAIHVAMNWRWIGNAVDRLVFAPIQRLSGGDR